jgi:hypothetical protein
MYVNVALETTFYCQFVAKFMIYVQTNFPMLISSTSLVIAVKLKTTENFRIPDMLLFYILQKLILKTFHIFPGFYHHKSIQNPVLRGASVASTSQVRASEHLVITDCRKFRSTRLRWSSMAHCSYHISWINGFKSWKRTNTHTDTVLFNCTDRFGWQCRQLAGCMEVVDVLLFRPKFLVHRHAF